MEENKLQGLNGTTLKILAMAFMFCDHLWGTIVPGAQWLTSIGRLAFPIFAFFIAEGYAHTHNFKKYLLRMFLFALVSEVPYNLMMAGGPIDPFEQNVMFTFCEALLMLRLLDWAEHREKKWIYPVMIPVTCLLGYALGFITFVDYFGFGILTVILFHLTREVKYGKFIQLVGMVIINFSLMGGMTIPIHLFGMEFLFPPQGLAVLALVPIWMYNGQRGPGGKVFQYFNYLFYPAHILILSLIALYAV